MLSREGKNDKVVKTVYVKTTSKAVNIKSDKE